MAVPAKHAAQAKTCCGRIARTGSSAPSVAKTAASRSYGPMQQRRCKSSWSPPNWKYATKTLRPSPADTRRICCKCLMRRPSGGVGAASSASTLAQAHISCRSCSPSFRATRLRTCIMRLSSAALPINNQVSSAQARDVEPGSKAESLPFRPRRVDILLHNLGGVSCGGVGC